nr:Hp60=heat shock protein 60 homolog {N-terminal} [Hansenula polymorpha, CBS 4732, Peptide Partial, 11 aa] [Ogataea polymorpha]
SHKELKFGVEG